jgi:DNA primase
MPGDAERLLQNIPIESYISKYVQLKKKGNNFWAICPFHSEKSPSFSVSPEKGIFKCFGCGKGGNVITFVQEYERVDFVEALKLLSEYSGIPLEGGRGKSEAGKTHRDLLLGINQKVRDVFVSQVQQPSVAAYLKERKIREDSIKHFYLGYSPHEFRFLENWLGKNITRAESEVIDNALFELGLVGRGNDHSTYNRYQDRLIFPIIDVKGKCIAFGGRIIENRDNTAKYVNSPESIIFSKKNCLYNINHAKEPIRKAQQVVLVEGYLDVVGLYQAGIENVVAPLGTAFTEEQARMIKRYTDRVIFFFDNDGAGIEASFKAMGIARTAKLDARAVIQSVAKDPFDISGLLNQVDILTLLDTAKSEQAFVLWYFFNHKYSLNSITEKRTAIEKFFEYIDDLAQEWEKEDYLKSASKVVGAEFESLKNDFKKFAKTGNVRPIYKEEVLVNDKVRPIEKEILSLLLKFPGFWQKEELIEQMQWKRTHKNIFLLYTFFRDRLKAGEFWQWDELNQAMNFLPRELTNLLSEILLEMDKVFSEWEKTRNDDEVGMESFFYKKLQSFIFLHKRDKLVHDINAMQKVLVSAENLQNEDIEEIAEELDKLNSEKTKIEKFLSLSRS